jgi:type I restriction enzyme M protein
MAIQKSDLYSSLWASCDELRGGMDASQYNDYVLFMLFKTKDKGWACDLVPKQWLQLNTEEAELKKAIRDAEAALDQLAYEQYPKLTESEIQTLVVDDKWLTTLSQAIEGELDRVSQTLTSRIRLLADRYAAPLPQIVDEVEQLAAKVAAHLERMGVKA